jgi:hypothetical protein
VADRLGPSFSAYRRHLTAAVDRLTEWLWRQEQETPQIETIAGHSTERAFMDTPIDHFDNITARRTFSDRLRAAIMPRTNWLQYCRCQTSRQWQCCRSPT